jgi:hypothetical protein
MFGSPLALNSSYQQTLLQKPASLQISSARVCFIRDEISHIVGNELKERSVGLGRERQSDTEKTTQE